jgi:hypothetical protein
MNCDQVRKHLLSADSVHPADQPEMVRIHLDGCRDCCKFTERLFKLERAWRELPAPAGAEESKRAFLQRLAAGDTRPAEKLKRPWHADPRVLRYTVAATLVVVIPLAVWFAIRPNVPRGQVAVPTEQASAKVINQIVEWNLALASADVKERDELVKQKDKLQVLLQHMSFTPDDRAFAQKLLEKGAKLAENPDPLAAAEHFDAIAAQVQEQLAKAVQEQKTQDVDHWANLYGSIDQRGVQEQLDQVQKQGLDQKNPEKMQELKNRNAQREQNLKKMLAHQPDAVQQRVIQKMHHMRKKGPGKGG